MKFLTTLFAALLTIVIGCNSEIPDNPVISEADSRQIMTDFFTALSTADTTLMIQLTSDDMIMYEHEQIWTRDSLLALMPATLGRIWEIQDVTVRSEGELSHIHYYNISRKPVGRSWLESALLVRDEGEIKIKFMHSTKLYLNN
ncbi:hypothetical protein AB2B38_012265 [Balneola sp. MJW-20]|uniref:hypothetical protein n=1 Tax=Gracilimonas aurantiaca TaxID=3234185 RepID=UPI0034671140